MTGSSVPADDRDRLAEGVLAEPLLYADDVAALLAIPVSSVYLYARRGLLPHVRVGRHVRFIRRDIQRAIADRATE